MQCQKPSGFVGRLHLMLMNRTHSGVTDWGLTHVEIEKRCTILDVGCGGGRTINKLAAAATEGKVFGIDYSEESVAASKRKNALLIKEGRVDVQQASVDQLPFPENMFDVVTAVETHFWWSDLAGGMREIFRVVKPAGKLVIIAEVYKGAKTKTSALVEKYAAQSGMKLLTDEEHRQLFTDAGFTDIRLDTKPGKGWIYGVGVKSS